MPQLLINADDGTELLRVQIKKIDPATATIAILKALEAIPEPKKQRSDRGKKRAPRLNLPETANGERSQVIP